MARFSSKVSFGLAFLGLAACGAAPPPPPSQASVSVAPHETLSRIVDRYWDERAVPGNALSPQFLADSLAVERRFLAEVLTVPRAGLDAEAGLTYDIFKRRRELDIEGFTYPSELLPVNPVDSMPEQFARAAAELGQHPLKDAEDYENWLLRIDGYVRWTKQAIANMREGMRRGYTLPRVLMERTLPVLQGFGEDTTANVFYLALRTMPDTVKEAERTRLASSLNNAIKDKLLPAYREMHDFIRSEYLPRARTSVSLSVLPLGPSWYAYRLKLATDTQLTANEIHKIGLTEVDRIRARLLALSASPSSGTSTSAGTGTSAATGAGAGAGELLSAIQELKMQTLSATPSLSPASRRQISRYVALAPVNRGAPLLIYQRAAPDGRTPAILYVNTAPSTAGPAMCRFRAFCGKPYRDATFNPRFSRSERTCLGFGDSAQTRLSSRVGLSMRHPWARRWGSTVTTQPDATRSWTN